MLAKRIIPCLDVERGRVVKGIRFVDLIDAGDPVEQARRYDREGADELVFLDITASSESRELVREMARRVADSIFIPFTVGGGIRTLEDMRATLSSGADKVSVNTAALKDPSIITEGSRSFGSQAIVVAIDARRAEKKDGETRGRGDGATVAPVSLSPPSPHHPAGRSSPTADAHQPESTRSSGQGKPSNWARVRYC